MVNSNLVPKLLFPSNVEKGIWKEKRPGDEVGSTRIYWTKLSYFTYILVQRKNIRMSVQSSVLIEPWNHYVLKWTAWMTSLRSLLFPVLCTMFAVCVFLFLFFFIDKNDSTIFRTLGRVQYRCCSFKGRDQEQACWAVKGFSPFITISTINFLSAIKKGLWFYLLGICFLFHHVPLRWLMTNCYHVSVICLKWVSLVR